jgi:hypothetical protein
MPENTPRRSKAADKLAATNEAAYESINAQKAARDAKTARLREQRLAREAEKAAAMAVKRKR